MARREVDLDATLEAMDGMRIVHEGISGRVHTFKTVDGYWRVSHEADSAGRASEAYREVRRELGDDWTTFWDGDVPTPVWAKAERLGLIKYREER